MALMAVQLIDVAGLAPALSAVSAQDTFEAGGSDRVFLHVANGGAGSITVTIAAVRAIAEVPGVGELAVPDIAVAVAAGAEKMIGPFNSAYADADGTVTVDYSGTTSVTAAAIKLAKGK